MIERLAVAAYRLCLGAFPARHRDRYASEMIEALRRAVSRRTADRGAWRAIGFTIAACVDALGAGVGERRRRRRRAGAGWDGWSLGIAQDLRYVTRGLAKSWTFTFVCLFSLSVGLGVTLALTLLWKVTANPTFELDTDGLVELLVTSRGRLAETWSYPDFVDLEAAAKSMDVTGWAVGAGTLRASDGEQGERVRTAYVSANYFETLGIVPVRGRGFIQGDDAAPEGVPVVVAHALWQNRLGGQTDIIGRVLTLNRAPHVVVGVAPEDFPFQRVGFAAEVWIPITEHPLVKGDAPQRYDRDADWVQAFARLDEGTALEGAEALVGSVMAGLASEHPETNAERRARVLPYRWQGARVRAEAFIIPYIFMALSGALLLVICLNLAGMVLVRSATRERELALRLAIGSSRRRLVRYLMTEAVVLALLGGGLVIGVLWIALQALSWRMGRPLPPSLAIDVPIVGLCMGVSLATTLVFAFVPALRFSRPKLLRALKDDVGGGGRRAGLVHRIAVSLQAGIALPALVVAGGVTQGARSMSVADFGVVEDGLFVSTPMELSSDGYDEDDVGTLARSFVDAVGSLAGVESVAVADGAPMDAVRRGRRVSTADGSTTVRARVTRIGEGYLETLGVPLLRGRTITAEDEMGAEPVAVVTATFAERVFAGQDPIGQRLTVMFSEASERATFDAGRDQDFPVVGVAGEVAGPFLESSTDNVFVSFRQEPTTTLGLVVRATSPHEALAAAIHRTALGLDPDLARPDVVSFDSLVEARSRDFPVWSVFLTVIATLLLLLSALGVYGVVSFAVANRTREIGVRMSLGSTRRRVLETVLWDAMKLAIPGLVVGGIAGVVGAQRVLNQMYVHVGLPMADERIIGVAAVVALSVVVLASVSPARRAAGVDPMAALRAD